jgi:molecular chaperone GrpE (heat shock protein)
MKDLNTALQLTRHHLQSLETQIQEGVHHLSPGSLENSIRELSKDGNLITQEINKAKEKAVQADADLNYQLLASIDRIRRDHAFWMAVGSAQEALLNALKKIETSLRKWMPKVEKTEQHPM